MTYKNSQSKAVTAWNKRNPEKHKEWYKKYRASEKGIKAAMEAQRRYRAKKKLLQKMGDLEN